MTIHGKFVGRLIRKPERTHGFTTLALTLDVDFHDRTDSNGDTMAEVICFPLYRRQKLVRRLRQANTDNEFRHALKRTAESLARIGVPLATIDAQIRLISLMTRRQMWSCRPEGAA
jgi:hypothetical protein